MREEQESQPPDDQTVDEVEDLDVEQSAAEEVKGGARKAGGKQEDYLQVRF